MWETEQEEGLSNRSGSAFPSQVSSFFPSVFVTEKDPMGSSLDRPLPHTLCFNSSLKHLDNIIWCTYPKLFYRCETTTKWKKLTTWWPWAYRPQTYWHLRIDVLASLTSPVSSPSTSQSTMHELFTHLGFHSFTLPLKCFPETHQSSGVLGTSSTGLLDCMGLVTQLSPTLCDPMDSSPPGPLFIGIL